MEDQSRLVKHVFECQHEINPQKEGKGRLLTSEPGGVNNNILCFLFLNYLAIFLLKRRNRHSVSYL